jgi:anti-sigma factor RsiW
LLFVVSLLVAARRLGRAAEDEMAAAERPISTDELHAYVDDCLTAASREEMERYLGSHPDLARQVSSYRAQRDRLRAALAPHAAAPIPPELNLNRLLEARLRRRWSSWRVAAAMLLGLGLGGAAGLSVAWRPAPDRAELATSLLRQQALASHTVYADDRRHPIEVAASESDHLSQWLSNRLRRSITPPDLTALGYRLLGGRLLATEHGGAAALFVYDDSQGNRLSVLLRPMAQELWARHADMSQGALNGCTWIDHGMGYAVVAAASDHTLDKVADQIIREVGGAG